MEIDRRELCSLLPLFLTSAAWTQQKPSFTSGVFTLDTMPTSKPNGSAEFRSIVNGSTPTGERVEIHETTLHPGHSPHPPNRHAHSEFWLKREGLGELTLKGRPYRLSAGSAGFAASNDEHGIKNIGRELA